VCAFCHEDLLTPPPADEDAQQHGRVARALVRVGFAIVAWLCKALQLLLGNAACGAVWSAIHLAWRAAASGSLGGRHVTVASGHEAHCVYCRWGCGQAVHRKCAASWGRDVCVFCSAPMS
jgi:hypothetical protein